MTPLPADFVFLAPWVAATPPDQQLCDELRRELSPGHPLFDRAVEVIALRVDTDDVLFAVAGPRPFAVVHLTWNKETSPVWPFTGFFDSIQQWRTQGMDADHAEYRAGLA